MAEDDLKSGCSLCYEDPYSERTASFMIINCAGPVLFVGAMKSWWWLWQTKKMYLGAFALASEVHQTTVLNTPHLSNGVYWYFTPGKSFGFLADMDLQQEPAEDTGTTNADVRLSWNLDNGRENDRAGVHDGERDMTKFIYNCPNGRELTSNGV